MTDPDEDNEDILARLLRAEQMLLEAEFEEAEQYLAKGRRFSHYPTPKWLDGGSRASNGESRIL